MSRDWFRSFFDEEYLSLLKDQWPSRATRAQVDFLERVLRLRPGARILDVACGYGRHAAELARRGYCVVGLDLSPVMLAEAARRFSRRRNLEFVRGDMRALEYRSEFDAVICMFSSFGNFSHRENVDVLRRMVRALRPGGRLLVDCRHLEFSRKRPAPRLWWRVGRDRFVLFDLLRYNPRTAAAECGWLILRPRRRQVLRRRFRQVYYDLANWRAMLRRAGAPLKAAYADYDDRRRVPARGSGLTGSRLIVLGQISTKSPGGTSRGGRGGRS